MFRVEVGVEVLRDVVGVLGGCWLAHAGAAEEAAEGGAGGGGRGGAVQTALWVAQVGGGVRRVAAQCEAGSCGWPRVATRLQECLRATWCKHRVDWGELLIIFVTIPVVIFRL